MLGPATLLLVVWSTISALQLFDEVFFVTKGGPLGRTSVVVFYVYRLAFEQGLGGLALAGYAAAIAYVLFLVILVLTLAQFWLGNRVVHQGMSAMPTEAARPAVDVSTLRGEVGMVGAAAAAMAPLRSMAPLPGAARVRDAPAARCGWWSRRSRPTRRRSTSRRSSWPGTLRFENYAEAIRTSQFWPVVLEHHGRDDDGRGSAT